MNEHPDYQRLAAERRRALRAERPEVLKTDHQRLTPEQRQAHRITWWVYVGTGPDRERIRHEASMRGEWGYDATCSCGWDSRIGAGLRRAVERKVEDHKRDVRLGLV